MLKWLVLLIVLLFVYHVREVFPPFIVGAIFAYLLSPIVGWLNHKWRFPPFLSVLLIYLGTGTLLVLSTWYFLPTLADQMSNLFEQRRDIMGKLLEQICQATPLKLNVEQTTNVLLSEVQSSVGKPEEIMHLGGIVSKSLLSLLVCAVTSIYMLVDGRRVGRFFLRFVQPDKRATVVSLCGQMDVMFRKYVWGQAFLISFMSAVAFCILTNFHLKYALLIALLTGFLEIIPVLGPLLAIMIATGFAVAQLGLAKAGWIALCYWIARLVEDYVVVPNTIGHAVELHPLAVIFAVVVGETMAGALGMLIAIPVAAAIKVVLDFFYPSTTTSLAHQQKKHSMAWMIEMFKRPPKAESEFEHQAKLDTQAIESMYEGSAGSLAYRSEQHEHREHKDTATSLAKKESPLPAVKAVTEAIAPVPPKASVEAKSSAVQSKMVEKGDFKESAGKLPSQELKESAGKLPSQELKESAGKQPSQELKESAGKQPSQELKESAGKLPSQELKESAGKQLSQELKESAGKQPSQELKESAGKLPSQELKESADKQPPQGPRTSLNS